MTRRSMFRVIHILAAVLACESTAMAGDPVVHLVDLKSGRDTTGVTRADVRQIVHLVSTIENIDHDVRMIDAVSTPSDVTVVTGPWTAKHGVTLRIKKRAGRWFVVSKEQW